MVASTPLNPHLESLHEAPISPTKSVELITALAETRYKRKYRNYNNYINTPTNDIVDLVVERILRNDSALIELMPGFIHWFQNRPLNGMNEQYKTKSVTTWEASFHLVMASQFFHRKHPGIPNFIPASSVKELSNSVEDERAAKIETSADKALKG